MFGDFFQELAYAQFRFFAVWLLIFLSAVYFYGQKEGKGHEKHDRLLVLKVELSFQNFQRN